MNVPKLFSLSPRFVLSLCRPLHSCIPVHPVVPPHEAHKGKTFKKISEKDIEHLERLSLVDFGNLRGIQVGICNQINDGMSDDGKFNLFI